MNYHIFLYLWIHFKNFYNYKDLPNVPDVMISYTGTVYLIIRKFVIQKVCYSISQPRLSDMYKKGNIWSNESLSLLLWLWLNNAVYV